MLFVCSNFKLCVCVSVNVFKYNVIKKENENAEMLNHIQSVSSLLLARGRATALVATAAAALLFVADAAFLVAAAAALLLLARGRFALLAFAVARPFGGIVVAVAARRIAATARRRRR